MRLTLVQTQEAHHQANQRCLIEAFYHPHLSESGSPYSSPSRAHFLQALDRVNDAALDVTESDVQNVGCSFVVDLVDALRWKVSSSRARRWQHILVLREMLLDDLRDLSVREIARDDKEPFVGCFRPLKGTDMAQGNIAHINKNKCARGWYLALRLALDEVPYPLVRGVESVQAVQVVNDWAKHQWWVHRGNGKVWLFILDKVPRGLLCKGLGCAVAVGWIFECLFVCDWVPIGLAVFMFWPEPLGRIYDGGKR